MLVISSREFRQNQKMYLNLVDNNEQVIVQRGKDKAYKILPVSANDTCLTEEDFYAKIDYSLRQADEGKVSKLTEAEQKELLGL